jgi:outer membrane protein OmpA-like peptidoglycan-associated protein
MDPDRSSFGSLKTINNDLFSGTIVSREIQIILSNDRLESIGIDDLDSLFIEFSGRSHPVLTTIFTMSNGDRFSGQILNPEVKIRAERMTATYEVTAINRIDFAAAGPEQDRLLLTNGDIIQGKLVLDEISVEPDSIAQFSADIAKFRSIQFNSRKMLIGEYKSNPSLNPDFDRDGVPDMADNCKNTPWGDPVDENGCSTGKIVGDINKPLIKGVQLEDEDGDGVPNSSDMCPKTPRGAKVDEKGCWATQEILFDFDSNLIKPSYYPVLDDVFTVLAKNPTLKIEIQGRADNIGTSEYNQILSEQRARAVKKYLVEKGIEPARLGAVGYGSTQTAASNDTAAGRALNRRIDFQVME